MGHPDLRVFFFVRLAKKEAPTGQAVSIQERWPQLSAQGPRNVWATRKAQRAWLPKRRKGCVVVGSRRPFLGWVSIDERKTEAVAGVQPQEQTPFKGCLFSPTAEIKRWFGGWGSGGFQQPPRLGIILALSREIRALKLGPMGSPGQRPERAPWRGLKLKMGVLFLWGVSLNFRSPFVW